MLTILFISDDTRVADLIARLQPQFKVRMRLALDFDQGLKEVFDNRPSAVFIHSDISGISGETVARHIKTLLRAEAPRVVLIHTSPLSVQGTKKWFDDAVDFSLKQIEIVEQLTRKLKEIAPDHWLEKNHVELNAAESVSPSSVVADSMPVSPECGEIGTFDWETVANGVIAAVESSSAQSAVVDTVVPDSAPAMVVPLTLPDNGDAGLGTASPERELRDVMSSITEESAATQSAFSEQVPSPSVGTPPPTPPPGEEKPLPIPHLPPTPLQGNGALGKESTTSLRDFSAEIPEGGNAEWVTIPSPDQEQGGGAGQRLTLWAAAIVVLLIGAVVGGALLLKGEGSREMASVKPAAQVPAPARPVPAPAAVVKAASAEGLPSFVPSSGKDQKYGKAHPGWERYRGDGIEYRIFREKGRLKAVQIIAHRGKSIPDTLVANVVKELTGSESRTLSSQATKGGYQRELGRVAGKGEVVIYRKGGSVRGVVVTLG